MSAKIIPSITPKMIIGGVVVAVAATAVINRLAKTELGQKVLG